MCNNRTPNALKSWPVSLWGKNKKKEEFDFIAKSWCAKWNEDDISRQAHSTKSSFGSIA
jgi:hypothetical protein